MSRRRDHCRTLQNGTCSVLASRVQQQAGAEWAEGLSSSVRFPQRASQAQEAVKHRTALVGVQLVGSKSQTYLGV